MVPRMCDALPLRPRAATRKAVDLPCEVVGPRSDEPMSFRVVDMSTSGLWLATHEPLRAGEVVVVCFRPRDFRRELMVFAEVARVVTTRRLSADAGMGLTFLDLSGDERHRLRMWLQSRRAPGPRRAPLFATEGAAARALRAAGLV